ncbi:DUF2461 domain-containing protein [Anaerostipes sp.]|uniref:DUF2461 domain-containing protein n=1 Tax=Anaerostipes sp. TaxID=1872530 RepID=UPI0025C07D1F|nr:DUF2461 domain-containing protein [Anaerostipes sp.]MBS7007408.1 DUF2461 domain-containing protein [Anaerostipes sp.]
MNTDMILTYLSELSKNNSRDWYHDHKKEYKEANTQFESLVQELIFKIGEFDSSILDCQPKDLTFKIVRDTRFSRDKTPYLPAFRAHIGPKGKLPVPVGYYLMVMPGNRSFLGGGLFAGMFKDATAMVRDYISEHPEEWEKILHSEEFQPYFSVQGISLKNVPSGYDKEHPQAEYLKFKSWYVEYPVKDTDVMDADCFISHAADIYKRMKPFNDFLNKALSEFEMPKRP